MRRSDLGKYIQRGGAENTEDAEKKIVFSVFLRVLRASALNPLKK
jgi:hypothetical protein